MRSIPLAATSRSSGRRRSHCLRPSIPDGLLSESLVRSYSRCGSQLFRWWWEGVLCTNSRCKQLLTLPADQPTLPNPILQVLRSEVEVNIFMTTCIATHLLLRSLVSFPGARGSFRISRYASRLRCPPLNRTELYSVSSAPSIGSWIPMRILPGIDRSGEVSLGFQREWFLHRTIRRERPVMLVFKTEEIGFQVECARLHLVNLPGSR